MKKLKKDKVELVKCPHCSAMLNPKNLKRHLKKVHSVQSEKRIHKKKAKKSVAKRDAATRIKRLGDRAKDKSQAAIAAYLKRNPAPNTIGKFGVPQDKYRWGFYGSASMAYDVWGRPA